MLPRRGWADKTALVEMPTGCFLLLERRYGMKYENESDYATGQVYLGQSRELCCSYRYLLSVPGKRSVENAVTAPQDEGMRGVWRWCNNSLGLCCVGQASEPILS